MAFCLVEVQADMPEALLEKLTAYQQTHQLESVSQAVMTALAAFFELEATQLKPLSSDTNLLQRVAQIEAVMPRLMAQIAALESQGSFAPLDAKQEGTGAASESKALMPVRAQQVCRPALTDPLAEAASNFQGSLPKPAAAPEARAQVSLSNAHLHPFPIELAPEDWTKGITTNRLVARLQTNPATLKKYLRDLKQRQWAVERDPNGLEWTYDPLLERYYPALTKATDHTSTGIAPASDAERPEWLERQATQNDNYEPVPDAAPCEGHECKGGLTQSQLSRLTTIPNNTLQRWKYLPDCAERIRCRTEGTFAYWYVEQNRRFYPL